MAKLNVIGVDLAKNVIQVSVFSPWKRELLVHERVSLSNPLRELLVEFGIVIPQGFAALYRQLPEIMEDADYRQGLRRR